MKTSNNNSTTEIDQGGQRGEYLLLGELMSPWDLSITSHESDCRWKIANDKLMISEVMSFVCSDSCENGITREKVLSKCSGKSPFSEYPWFQSNAL